MNVCMIVGSPRVVLTPATSVIINCRPTSMSVDNAGLWHVVDVGTTGCNLAILLEPLANDWGDLGVL